MAKGKGKMTSNSESSASAQPRSLRSRKRDCPGDDRAALSDNTDQPILPPQDSEGNVTKVDAAPAPPSPLQKDTTGSAQQGQATYHTVEKVATEENSSSATVIFEEGGKGETAEEAGQDETILINPNSDLRVDSTSENNPGGKKVEEVAKQEPNRSPPHASSDQPRPSTPASCVAVFKEQRCGGDSSAHNMEGVQDAQQEPTGVHMSHDNGKEPATWCPAKKKRRMGMCGLTDKERSHFLQTQKRENGQNGTVGNERHKSDEVGEEENTCSAPLSSPPSIAAVSVTEQTETDLKLQLGYCEAEDRAETDVHIAMTTSDGTRNGGDPAGSSEGHTCQADPSNVPHPAQVSDSELDPPAEDGEHSGVSHALVGEEQQEQSGSTVETIVKKDETQTKDGDDGSGILDGDPGSTFPTNTSQNEGSEREERDGSQASAVQMDSVVGTTNGRVEGTGGEAWDGDGDEATASTGATKPGELSCGSVDLCGATVTPSGSAGEGNCGPKDTHGTGPTPGNTERPQTRLTPDPFGSGSLDYVSDSQLNSIVLIDDMMEQDWDLSSSDCREDATDLVCGLIRELSSLNRTVMATHRELENLRRGNKVSRASTH